MDAKDIKNFAEELKDYFHTNDPFALAEIFGIKVIINRMMSRDRKAYTIKTGDYPTCIIINGRYSGNSQIVLCAHELGHALLHNDGINSFAVTKENVFTNIEYEANLLLYRCYLRNLILMYIH